MNDKAMTQASYEATAEEFTNNVAPLAPLESIQKFVNFFPPKGKIIDLGCGSGRDAKIFSEKGLSVLGIDFCHNLINIAKKNAPLAQFQIMDIEKILFPQSSFDGAWAGCVLSHIPKKTLPLTLENIHSILKAGGYFYLTVKKGVGEGLKEDLRYDGQNEKFWSFFEEDEIAEYVKAANFHILDCCTVQKKFDYQTDPCVRIFCQKN